MCVDVAVDPVDARRRIHRSRIRCARTCHDVRKRRVQRTSHRVRVAASSPAASLSASRARAEDVGVRGVVLGVRAREMGPDATTWDASQVRDGDASAAAVDDARDAMRSACARARARGAVVRASDARYESMTSETYARTLARTRMGIRAAIRAATGANAGDDEGASSDEDGETMFEVMRDVLDARCDAVDACVMLARGDDGRGATAATAGDASGGASRGSRRDATSTRPQDAFEDAVDNRLENHSHKGLMRPIGFDSYEDFERKAREDAYPAFARESGGTTLPTPMDDEHPLVVVDTEDALEELATHLEQCKEFAVDLEHHSYRSFKGFTCLMQVSTREKDFVVDVLALRSLVRDALGKAFADPNTLKVMHGADNDVQWLQKDFGIFVSCLFDTGQAARVLELPSKALAYLLQHYCGIKANKKFQLADWRVRPLTREMLDYARGDTHYLLYVYDELKKALAARGENSIAATLTQSRDVCLKKYLPPTFDEGSYYEDLLKTNNLTNLNDPQLAVYAALFKWRDAAAREADESLGYVMPRELMLRLAIAAPSTKRALMEECRGQVPLIAKHAETVADLISRARAMGAPSFKPSLVDPVDVTAVRTTANVTEPSNATGVTTNLTASVAETTEQPERAMAPIASAPTKKTKRKRGGSMAALMGGHVTTAASSPEIIPMHEIFNVWGDDAAPVVGTNGVETVTAAPSAATAAPKVEDSQPVRRAEIEIPGLGIRVPAPFRKAGSDLPFTMLTAEPHVVEMSRADEAAAARAELEARRAERMRGYDESDSDSDSEDARIKADLLATADKLNDPAKRDSFTKLATERFGASGIEMFLREEDQGPKKGFNERFKSVYEEPFKAGPKSRAFPRSGNRYTTFDK